NELLGLLRSPKSRLHFDSSIVVEAEVGGRKALFQNCHAGKQAQRLSLHLIRRRQQNFPLALKESSRYFAHYVFGKGDGAIFQSDVDCSPVQRCPPHFENPRSVESHAAELKM